MDIPIYDSARRPTSTFKELFEIPRYRVRIRTYRQEWQS